MKACMLHSSQPTPFSLKSGYHTSGPGVLALFRLEVTHLGIGLGTASFSGDFENVSSQHWVALKVYE